MPLVKDSICTIHIRRLHHPRPLNRYSTRLLGSFNYMVAHLLTCTIPHTSFLISKLLFGKDSARVQSLTLLCSHFVIDLWKQKELFFYSRSAHNLSVLGRQTLCYTIALSKYHLFRLVYTASHPYFSKKGTVIQ